MKCLITIGALLMTLVPSVVAADITDMIQITSLTLPATLESAIGSWCTLGGCQLDPRLYHEPSADGSLVVGWTDSGGSGHVSIVADGELSATHTFASRRCKGLVVHDEGAFAVLLWDEDDDTMELSRRNADGSEAWSCNLNSDVAIFDNNIGDARLTFSGSYAAYYSVYGISGNKTGHNGDQLTIVSADGVVQGGWDWGCSHSMAQLLGYHPASGQLTALCSSDCYPDIGLVANDYYWLVPAYGNCSGKVGLQLGQMAAGATTWKVAFNAVDYTCCAAQGIGLATITAAMQTSVTWLTATDGSFERDPVLARLPDSGGERYLVGWRSEGATGDAFYLGIINGAGVFIEGPQEVGTAGIAWNRRDDSLCGNPDGSVTWLQGDPSSSMLRLFRYINTEVFSDGFETGTTGRWSETAP